MSTLFSINFRREAFLRERAAARRRILGLGLWLAYFGVLGVVFGLYGLNCVSLGRRTEMLERQGMRLSALNQGGREWRPSPAALGEVGGALLDARQWRDILAHLGGVLPRDARLTSLQFNPDNVSGAGRKLVLAGQFKGPGGQDRTGSVVALVRAIARDSVIAARFSTVRLLTSRASATAGGADFVIECR